MPVSHVAVAVATTTTRRVGGLAGGGGREGAVAVGEGGDQLGLATEGRRRRRQHRFTIVA